MKGMKIIAAAAGIVVLAVVAFWWIQKKRAEEQASRPTLIVREQPLANSFSAPEKGLSPTEAVPSVVVDESGSFTVQISSWRSNVKAENVAERFRSAGYAAYVQRVYLPSLGGVWYRVRVGQFKARAEAERQARDLEVQLDSGYWITQKQ
ncbi:MAG: SPOR domain-containing protein [candidate division KSB1 bacterium]